MSSQLSVFTADHRCRCQYDGTGVHRCHAGRPDPRVTGEDGSRHCPEPAVCRLVATMSCLAGTQMKLGVTESFYCEEHTKEVFGLK